MSVDLDQKLVRSDRLQAIKSARDQARTLERQAEKSDADKDPDNYVDPGRCLPFWRTVIDLARKAFDEQAKDLEIAVYMIEALVRIDGFAGLREGFQVARELVVRSWDELFPMPDEDGVATRVRRLADLNGIDSEGVLIAPINRVPITQGRTVGPYSFWHWQQRNEHSSLSSRERQAREDGGGVNPERFKQAVAETDTGFFRQLVAEITDCRDEFDALAEALVDKCGTDDHGLSLSPPTSAIRAALQGVLDAVTSDTIAKSRLAAGAPTTAANVSSDGSASPSMPNSNGQSAPGEIRSREDAFRMLEAAADFLAHAEPQSLLPAQIRKVVRWGRLPPAEYYEQLLQDSAVIENLFKLVGIEKPESNSSSE